MSTPSPALLHKIAKARANALSDLPLVRNSAYVVLAWAVCGGELDAAIANLKASHGSNWSLTTALQLLSGRRGQFAAECGTDGERAMLYLAHLVAKSACCQEGLGAVTMPTQAEMQELRNLAAKYATLTPSPTGECGRTSPLGLDASVF